MAEKPWRKKERVFKFSGFCNVFLVDLINTCHWELSPLVKFSWHFQYLSSHYYCSWCYFNYSLLLLLNFNCLSGSWVMEGKIIKRDMVIMIVNGGMGDIVPLVILIL